MNNKLTVILLFLIALLIVSCGDPTAPEDLLEEDRYIDVFSELVVVNQIDEEQLDGVSREYLKEQVFEEYGVTKEQFERSHLYYQKQPEEHIRQLDMVEEQLTEQRDRFQDRLNDDRKQLADSLTRADSVAMADSLSANDVSSIGPDSLTNFRPDSTYDSSQP